MPVHFKTYLLAGVTVLVAASIGYRMQYGDGAAQPAASIDAGALSDIAMTSSAGAAAQPPRPAPPQVAMPAQASVPADPGAARAEQTGECRATMTAEPAAGAMITLNITASCNGGDRVTLYHHGLIVTETLDAGGTLSTRIPALSETAVINAEFASGGGGTATTEVTSLPFYDRVVVQWTGDAGLQLHAREFGAPYFTDGHVWAEAAGNLGAAAQGQGGFLVRLGDAAGPEARMAEVYSFPTGTAQRGGVIAMSVEAEVTAANCGRAIEAQTIQHTGADGMTARDLELRMPGCDSVGDFLVLKNLVQDLNIASR